jgi:DNA invertase Pin-like site-specific DNA recombinase
MGLISAMCVQARHYTDAKPAATEQGKNVRIIYATYIDEGDMFSETSVTTRATRYNVPDATYYWHLRENIPQDSVLRT